MLHTAKKLRRCDTISTDGPLGTIDDLYFDDRRWVIRYLVVRTGGWLRGKKVLISPYAVQLIDWPSQSVLLRLTKAQIQGSPDIDTDKPVSRQQEEDLHGYYGYPVYWPYVSDWASGAAPVIGPLSGVRDELLRAGRIPQSADTKADTHGDSHLRSVNEVIGYTIAAQTELMGHVEDFLFDDETWRLRYWIAKTRNWLPGRHVLLEPTQIDEVDWPARAVTVPLTRQEIEARPDFDPEFPPMGDRERQLAGLSSRS